jgi:hypothetical protein
MRLKKVSDEQLMKMIIDEMFIIAGYTDVQYEDILKVDNWFQHYTMTQDQNNQWVDAAIKIIMRERRRPKYMAKKQMIWIGLSYGLKIINYEDKQK